MEKPSGRSLIDAHFRSHSPSVNFEDMREKAIHSGKRVEEMLWRAKPKLIHVVLSSARVGESPARSLPISESDGAKRGAEETTELAG